jgi:hypothetical protein
MLIKNIFSNVNVRRTLLAASLGMVVFTGCAVQPVGVAYVAPAPAVVVAGPPVVYVGGPAVYVAPQPVYVVGRPGYVVAGRGYRYRR